MNILVTGAAGFIGSSLVKRLSDAGHQVVGLDNFNDYYDVSLKEDRVAALIPDETLVRGDFGDKELLTTLFTEHNFDVVCHLAAFAGVRHSVEYPEKFIDTNIAKLITLLEVMREHDCLRMVFASSSSVYGNDTQAPFTESATAAAPESVYGATKRTGELLLHSYYSQYGLQSTSLRFFTVYGPWSRPDMMMLKFAQKMQAGEPIEIYNEGNMRRDFTYIDDIVAGFAAAVEKPLGYEIVNLGRGEPVELMPCIEWMETALGVSAKKELLPMQSGDVYETYASTTKAQKLLGFSAAMPMQEGIQRFADWFTSYYKV